MTVLGAMLLVSDGMQIAAACGMHGRDHWIAMLVSGILTTLVGAITFLAPGAAIFVFAIFAGVQLVFTGILMIRGGTEFVASPVQPDSRNAAMGMRDYLRHHYRHFNAAVVVDAAQGWCDHLDRGGSMFVTPPGRWRGRAGSRSRR